MIGLKPALSAPITAAVTLVLAAAACGDDSSSDAAGGQWPDGPPQDAAIPQPEGAVTTGYAVTVLDDGDGAELCLGAVAESYPPQCGGPELIGWDWEDQQGEYEEASGVRWGQFAVAGTFDPVEHTFTVQEVIPASEAEAPAGSQVDLSTPCPEPEGGHQVEDLQSTTEQSYQDTVSLAEDLPGFAGVWLDQSLNPVSVEDLDDEELEEEQRLELQSRLNDPQYMIINVQVTEDPDDAYETLRETWGGMLCVTEVQHTQDDLLTVQRDIMEIDGVLSAGLDASANVLTVDVEYDDGSFHSALEEHYGEGVVVINPVLQPAE